MSPRFIMTIRSRTAFDEHPKQLAGGLREAPGRAGTVAHEDYQYDRNGTKFLASEPLAGWRAMILTAHPYGGATPEDEPPTSLLRAASRERSPRTR